MFFLLFKVFQGFQIFHQEKIPSSGPVILASNHISNWDPMVVGSASLRQVRFIAKEELFKIPVVGSMLKAWGAFKVKRGRGDREAIGKSLEVLSNNEVLGIFIEGRRNTKNPEKMIKPQSGAAMLAVKSGAPVIPTLVINSNKLFRSFRRVKVIFGDPIVFKEEPGLDKKDLYLKISNQLVDEINKLRK